MGRICWRSSRTQVAQMRYFGVYSEEEIAETLHITERALQCDWEKGAANPGGGIALKR